MSNFENFPTAELLQDLGQLTREGFQRVCSTVVCVGTEDGTLWNPLTASEVCGENCLHLFKLVERSSLTIAFDTRVAFVRCDSLDWRAYTFFFSDRTVTAVALNEWFVRYGSTPALSVIFLNKNCLGYCVRVCVSFHSRCFLLQGSTWRSRGLSVFGLTYPSWDSGG